MIVFNCNGDAVTFDLHDWERLPFVLWSQNLALPPGHRIAIDAVLESTTAGFQTEFRIASVLNILDPQAPKSETVYSVWLVRPTFDATGHVNGVESELFSKFAGEPSFFRFALTFSGPLLGYRVKRVATKDFATIVWYWEQADGQTDFTKVSKWILPLPAIFQRRKCLPVSVFSLWWYPCLISFSFPAFCPTTPYSWAPATAPVFGIYLPFSKSSERKMLRKLNPAVDTSQAWSWGCGRLPDRSARRDGTSQLL